MDIRILSTDYSVSPQIVPEEVALIAAAGYRTLICNRPDSEIVPEIRSEPMRAAAEAAGLRFVDNQIQPGEFSPDAIRAQREAIDSSDGPVLAYCASGTRSTVVWMFGAVAETPVDEVIDAAVAAGYPLGSLRPLLKAAAQG